MKAKWATKTAAERKARVFEEIGEVLVEFGKCDRFGMSTRWNSSTGCTATPDATWIESNREALIRELEDLKGAIDAYLGDIQCSSSASCASIR